MIEREYFLESYSPPYQNQKKWLFMLLEVSCFSISHCEKNSAHIVSRILDKKEMAAEYQPVQVLELSGFHFSMSQKTIQILSEKKTKSLKYPNTIPEFCSEFHMCLVGRPNPYKLLQSWELTFPIGLTLLNTKLALKNFLTNIL